MEVPRLTNLAQFILSHGSGTSIKALQALYLGSTSIRLRLAKLAKPHHSGSIDCAPFQMLLKFSAASQAKAAPSAEAQSADMIWLQMY